MLSGGKMFLEPDKLEDVCEVCGFPTMAGNLYVHLFNHAWQFACPECFYKIYNAKPSLYYDKMKIVTPDLYTKKQYEKVKKAQIVIANKFSFVKEKGTEFAPEVKDQLLQHSLDMFLGFVKMKRKFNVYNVQEKTTVRHIEDGTPVLFVTVRAWVNFKSWLEYMEHEAYMHMRKELDNSVIIN